MFVLEEQVTTTTELDFTEYGPFVWVAVKSHSNRKKRRDGKSAGQNSTRPVEKGCCVSKAFYEANKDKPFKFLNISRLDQFEAVSAKFWQAYKAGTAWKLEFSEWHIDTLQALRDGKFERVIQNRYSNDHTILDVNGNIVPHCVFIDYINGQIRDGSYHLDKVVAHLKKRKDVKSVKVVDIPYYNAEFCGERAVEFTYVPPHSSKGWANFVEWYYPDTVGGKYKLYDKLKISKFRKNA